MSYDKLDKFRIDGEDEYNELCLKYGKDRVDREIDLELESKENAFNAFMSKRNRALESGTIGTMGASRVLISEAIPVMAKALDRWFKEVDTGKPGKRHVMASLIKSMSTLEIAFISIKTIIENSFGIVSLTKLSSAIGEAIEDELRFKMVVNAMDKKELSRFNAGLDKRISLLFKKRYMENKEKILSDEKRLQRWNRWGNANRVQIGLKLIDIFIVSTGLGYLEKTMSESRNVQYIFCLDSDVLTYLEHEDKETACLMFQNRPMVIPPKPWTTPFDGGYLINLKRPIQLVRMPSKECEQLYGEVDMPNVYKAVNAIQATAWRINRRVLEVANEVCSWAHIPEALEMPSATPAEPPVRPVEADTCRHRNGH